LVRVRSRVISVSVGGEGKRPAVGAAALAVIVGAALIAAEEKKKKGGEKRG